MLSPELKFLFFLFILLLFVSFSSLLTIGNASLENSGIDCVQLWFTILLRPGQINFGKKKKR